MDRKLVAISWNIARLDVTVLPTLIKNLQLATKWDVIFLQEIGGIWEKPCWVWCLGHPLLISATCGTSHGILVNKRWMGAV